MGLWLAGMLLGSLASWPLLAGNEQGQVNLLAVLALLVGLPLGTLVVTLVALLRRRSWLPPAWWQHMPLLPRAWKEELRRRRLAGESFWWLLHAGQWLMLGFGMGSLLALLLLLLFTDLHFVWRSTLLQAADLYPLLRWIAWPWWFWEAAQPSLELLQQTRDNRLLQADASVPFGDWWPFLLAAQLTYVVIPRLLLALWSASRLGGQRLRADPRPGAQPPPSPRASLAVDWPPGAVWVDAAWLPQSIAARLPQAPLPLQEVQGRPGPWVVVVRAWEPPMGELADRLRRVHGQILPLDWGDDGPKPPSAVHLDEWRRFAASLSGWSVLQLERDS